MRERRKDVGCVVNHDERQEEGFSKSESTTGDERGGAIVRKSSTHG